LADTLIGQVKIFTRPRGEYDPSVAYLKMDEVQDPNGLSIYQASEDIPAGTALTDSRWVKRIDGSKIEDTLEAETTLVEWSVDAVIVKGNKATHEGSTYQWTLDTPGTGIEPPADGWVLVASKGDKGDKGDRGDIGNVMYATFDVDDNGELVMTTPDGYTGPEFVINDDGEMEAVVNG
jgi:hypothetical protein